METHIGKLIRQQVSEKSDLTIRAFADKLGVHEQTVYDIYKRPDINTDLLRRVADALEVPLSFFLPELAETGGPPPPPRPENGDGAEVARPGDRAPRPARPAAEEAPEAAAPAPEAQKPEKPAPEPEAPRFMPPPQSVPPPEAAPRKPERAPAPETESPDARELAWAREKIELLEARLRDKEQMIALLRTLLPANMPNGKD